MEEQQSGARNRPEEATDPDAGLSLGEVVSALAQHLKLLIVGPVAAGALALGITYLIPPTFTASTTFLPPQQGQSAAASALASLGSLASLAGGAGGVRSPGEQFVSLMQSVTVSDRIIDQFKLLDVYEAKFRVDARKELGENVRINLGKKDGLITVQVDDHSPQRAAEMANRYVDELRLMTSTLAVSEAQQRRVFFQQQLEQSRGKLVIAQQALQASGFNPGALKAEPKAAAEGYARLKAEVTGAEVRLQSLRGTLTDNAPEIRQQQATLVALREQLSLAERATAPVNGPDYVARYREFKYQEALFELYARQFELARVDESREGALIQVVDVAGPPERKSRPRRAVVAAATGGLALIFLVVFLVLRHARRKPESGTANAH
ncbi:MAG: lipopolysaccharide biosynthesis protein [Acidovorax sp.]|nr:lipopolysaccharide biosynthesis protein [Acidovorax sp.]